MIMSPIVHRTPDFLLAVVSCWIGLSLLVRAPRDRDARVFAWFTLNLALYGLTAFLPLLTESPDVARVMMRLQLVETVIAPPVFLHFIMTLTSHVRIPNGQRVMLGIFYGIGVAMALYALFGDLQAVPNSPAWSPHGELRFPDGWLWWAWNVQRVLPLVAAIGLMWRAYRRTPGDEQEKKLQRIFALTALVGVVGAILATVNRNLLVSPLLPRTIILIAMIVLAYAVLNHRALLPERVARRTFFYSLIGSAITTIYVGLLLLFEWVIQTWLLISAPLLTIFSLVVLVAVLGPLREWFRDQLDRRFFRREFSYGRLLRSLSDDLFERGSLDDQLQAALSSICRTLEVQSGMVALLTPEGLIPRAAYGQEKPQPILHDVMLPTEPSHVEETWTPWQSAQLLLPLRRGDESLGLLALGPHYSSLPFNATERALLDHLGNYLALAITYERAREEQQSAIASLAEQRRALQAQQEQLAQQAADAALQTEQSSLPGIENETLTNGLRVYALGPLRVERYGQAITRWGGNKAGTYQAEALFAFLFDRRGKGVTKDEAAEVIWPDLEISKADAAFHRTLAALRRTLEPDLRRGNESRTILYHHERYWLEPLSIDWYDAEQFIAAAEQGVSLYHQGDQQGALAALERASGLYRGDYMDDCPFFGDSVYAEDQRSLLRARYVEVQLTLGALYEALGRAGEAITAYRYASVASPDGCPPASAGLGRLQAGGETLNT